jgi:low affinity Fe/Cu permease
MTKHRPDIFRRVARRVSVAMGTPWAFLIAVGAVLVWAACGPVLGFSENWQLVINTSTTIVTFLMVFLIQATQNRESKAVQLKLDELINATSARNRFADIEDAEEPELEKYQRDFEKIRRVGGRARAAGGASEGERD